MTLRVLEGHFRIASLFKCNFSYSCALRGPSAFAELLLLVAIKKKWIGNWEKGTEGQEQGREGLEKRRKREREYS